VLGAVIEQVQGQPLDAAVKTLVTGPLAMHNTGFAVSPGQVVATAYVNDQPEPHLLQEGEFVAPFENTVGICYSPSRVYNSEAYPSGGAGMVGTVSDVMRLLETLRSGGGSLLSPEWVAEMGRDQITPHALADAPGTGFGLGFSVLRDPQLAASPESPGTWRWGVPTVMRGLLIASANSAWWPLAIHCTKACRDSLSMICAMRSTTACGRRYDTRATSALLPLLALGMAAFVTIVTETLPAGLLTRMAHDLAITPAAAGQSVTVYAVGSFIAAIPLMSLLQGWRRRRLLLLTLAGFTLANTVTAFASNYGLLLAARGIAGIAAGILWALLAGFAASMAPAHKKGQAIAIAMAGTPLASPSVCPSDLRWQPDWLAALLCDAKRNVAVVDDHFTPERPGSCRAAGTATLVAAPRRSATRRRSRTAVGAQFRAGA
jgi:hypothetical protein